MNNNKIKLKQINLSNKEERDLYSKKLKEFENEFEYPLGASSFKISHGLEDDYFSFFDQMGETNYFVAEDNNKIVGAGCAVLRTSLDNKKYWYLCDFKINKPYRGQNILEKMMAKYFFKCVIKSHRVIAVNMNNSKIEENGLVKKIQKIFWFFNIQIEWLNFHQWTKEDIKKENMSLKDVYTNKGKKDILIQNEPWNLYHITDVNIQEQNVNNANLSKFKKIAINSLPENATIMCCTKKINDHFDKKSISGKGVIISSGMKNVKISSLEI